MRRRFLIVAVSILAVAAIAAGLYTSGRFGGGGHKTPAQAAALVERLTLAAPVQGPTRITGKFRAGWPKLMLDHCDVALNATGRNHVVVVDGWVCDTHAHAVAVVALIDENNRHSNDPLHLHQPEPRLPGRRQDPRRGRPLEACPRELEPLLC